MPKIKTNRAAAKRFKKTGSGKIVYRKSCASHILTKKNYQAQNKIAATQRITWKWEGGMRKGEWENIRFRIAGWINKRH